jgi:hypothetical protein
MISESFETFILACAGAGGGFIGLLFVAISIGQQRTPGDSAANGAAPGRSRFVFSTGRADWSEGHRGAPAFARSQLSAFGGR